jgi:hypothetical protein
MAAIERELKFQRWRRNNNTRVCKEAIQNRIAVDRPKGYVTFDMVICALL